MKLAAKYYWPLWNQVSPSITFFFPLESSFSPPSHGICTCFPSAYSKIFFFSLFLNSLQISFIHNCFLDCFPSVQIGLLKHLSWTLSRLRTRQNKFAPGNFILSTIFCGFPHHASTKIDALHVFWKELGLQGKFLTARTSQCIHKARYTWVAGGQY